MTTQVGWAAEAQFAPDRTTPAKARALVERCLTEHDRQHLVDDISLVVSELVTNAVVHARTPIRIRLEEMPIYVKLTVYDESVNLPVLSLASRVLSESEGGRGLWLVDACSTDWGTDLAGSQGKCIWALFGVSPNLRRSFADNRLG